MVYMILCLLYMMVCLVCLMVLCMVCLMVRLVCMVSCVPPCPFLLKTWGQAVDPNSYNTSYFVFSSLWAKHRLECATSERCWVQLQDGEVIRCNSICNALWTSWATGRSQSRSLCDAIEGFQWKTRVEGGDPHSWSQAADFRVLERIIRGVCARMPAIL